LCLRGFGKEGMRCKSGSDGGGCWGKAAGAEVGEGTGRGAKGDLGRPEAAKSGAEKVSRGKSRVSHVGGLWSVGSGGRGSRKGDKLTIGRLREGRGSAGRLAGFVVKGKRRGCGEKSVPKSKVSIRKGEGSEGPVSKHRKKPNSTTKVPNKGGTDRQDLKDTGKLAERRTGSGGGGTGGIAEGGGKGKECPGSVASGTVNSCV
jgi:hypothetical protein